VRSPFCLPSDSKLLQGLLARQRRLRPPAAL